VCADHGDRVARLPFVTDSKGDNGRLVTGEVVLSAGDERMCPGVAFLDLGIASCLKLLRSRVDSMECCLIVSAFFPWLALWERHTSWRGIDELKKVLGRLE
jgi:hypothetical protein